MEKNIHICIPQKITDFFQIDKFQKKSPVESSSSALASAVKAGKGRRSFKKTNFYLSKG